MIGPSWCMSWKCPPWSSRRCWPATAQDRCAGKLLHECSSARSIFLLAGGLLIRLLAGPEGIQPLDKPGSSTCSRRAGPVPSWKWPGGRPAGWRTARPIGAFLDRLAVVMPLDRRPCLAPVGRPFGAQRGVPCCSHPLSPSASYIAARPRMRIAVPRGNAGLSYRRGFGVTFRSSVRGHSRFYYWMAAEPCMAWEPDP